MHLNNDFSGKKALFLHNVILFLAPDQADKKTNATTTYIETGLHPPKIKVFFLNASYLERYELSLASRQECHSPILSFFSPLWGELLYPCPLSHSLALCSPLPDLTCCSLLNLSLCFCSGTHSQTDPNYRDRSSG